MIRYRLDAVNGGEKPTLSQAYKQGKTPPDSGENSMAKIARLMAEDALREANKSAEAKDALLKVDALYKELELEKSRYKALEAQRASEVDLFSQLKTQLTSQAHEAGVTLQKLTKEIEGMKSREQAMKDDADMSVSLQRTLVKDMETKLSQTFGKLAQSEKQNREHMEAARKMPQPMHSAAKIPSFEFTPVKDRDGKIVKVIATPTGG